MRTLKSEDSYTVDYGMTIEELKWAVATKKTVTGMVINYNADSQMVRVNLGKGLVGLLPWSEVGIQDFTYKKDPTKKIPDQVLFLRYRIVRVKVMGIQPDNTIILSRKANLLEQFEILQENSEDTVYNAKAVGVYSAGIIFDISDWVTAYCHPKEFSATKVDLDTWVKIGDFYDVCLMKDYNESISDFKLRCSRKQSSKIGYKNFREGEVVVVRVSRPIFENDKVTGFFVEITPNCTGIGDVVPNHYFPKVGDYVHAIIMKIIPDEMKMKLDIIDKAD